MRSLNIAIPATTAVFLSTAAIAQMDTELRQYPSVFGKQRFALGASYGSVGRIPMTSFYGSFKLLPIAELGVQVSRGGYDYGKELDTSEVRFESAEINITQATGFVRLNPFETSPSFGAKMAVGMRSFDFDFKAAEKVAFDPNYASASSKGTAGLVEIEIGNHWTFDNGITLGVDWLGLSSAIEGSYDKEVRHGRFADSGTKEETEDAVDNLSNVLGESTILKLLNLSFGFRF